MEDNIPGGCQRAEAVVDSDVVELEVEATEVELNVPAAAADR